MMELQAGTSRESFGFSGTAGAYFRIWIVNICLTILTLGIYSAWAKVRRYKYLYRSTHLRDAGFDYHAAPVAILKGRLIAFAVIVLYFVCAFVLPGTEGVVALIIIGVLPWLLVRSRMFNLRNTSYRNIRFSFRPAYGKAYVAILANSLLAGVTLGILYPWYKYRRSDFIVRNTSFGNLPMGLADVNRGFYMKYLQAAGILIAGMVLGFMAVGAFSLGGGVPESTGEESAADQTSLLLSLVPIAIFFFIYFGVLGFVRAATAKLVLNNMTIGDHQLHCDWNIPRVMFIQVTNLVAIALSAGLLIPWATIRLQRYQMNNLSVDIHGELDEIIGVQHEEVSALGDEIGEAFDIDVGI